MSTIEPIKITIEATIDAPVDKVWLNWNDPIAITIWNTASPDWHTPSADLDLRPGGKFNTRMEAKDGSMGFDFWGIYDVIEPNQLIEYTLGDNRKVSIQFNKKENETQIVQIFEAESENPIEMQQFGWQAILNSFKSYVETN